MLFLIGINTGLKMNNILNLKVKDVKNSSYIVIKNQSEKAKKFPINNALKEEINKYTENMKNDAYLFQSQKVDNQPI